jgi:hypothetical protein
MPETPDYKMFLKLLNLTTSQYDGEALNAIRMANAVLARTNQTWEDLLKGKVVMIQGAQEGTLSKSPTNIRHSDPNEINGYFETLYDRGSRLGTFKTWVDSVHEWWEEKGFLTDNQYNTLKKSAQRR